MTNPEGERRKCSECGEGLGFSESDPCGLCELKHLNHGDDLQRLKDAVCDAAKAWEQVSDAGGNQWNVAAAMAKLSKHTRALLHFEEQQK